MCRLSTLSLLLALALAACGPAKLLERDRPEAAFEKAVEKLERDPNKSGDLIAVAAEAYARLQAADQYALLEARDGNADVYGEIAVARLTALSERRARVDALRMRLKRPMRLRAWDQEPDYATELVTARVIAARRLLAAAEAKLPLARAGDRFAAREGFELLDRRARFTDASDVTSLRTEFEDLGTVRVALAVDGDLRGSETLLLDGLQRSLRDRWVRTAYPGERAKGWADVYATLDVPVIAPLRIRETVTTQAYEKVVETRCKRGVDSSGRPVYDTLRETVRAEVLTASRAFEQDVQSVVYIEGRDGERLRDYARGGRASVTRTEVEVRGDRRALVGVALPVASAGPFTSRDERRLVGAAIADLAGGLGKIDIDRLIGNKLLASTE